MGKKESGDIFMPLFFIQTGVTDTDFFLLALCTSMVVALHTQWKWRFLLFALIPPSMFKHGDK